MHSVVNSQASYVSTSSPSDSAAPSVSARADAIVTSSVEPATGLDALLCPTCDFETSAFVESALRLGAPALIALVEALGQLPRPQLEKGLSVALNSSSRGLDFIYALRSACSDITASHAKPASPRSAVGTTAPGHAPQARPDIAVDHACAGLLRPLHAPQLLHCTQLSLRPEHARLVQQARESETVQRAASEEAFAAKFGPGRQVHALVHSGAPDTLLAILYSAILPRLPSSVREIDRHSGTGRPVTVREGSTEPECTGQWVLSREVVAAMQPPHTAIAFYSVSTPHPATRGLQLGRRIIYSVAAATAAACPSIRTFATLSPIPGFTHWLRSTPQVVGSLLVHGQLEVASEAAEAVEATLRTGGPSDAAAAMHRPAHDRDDAAAVMQAAALLLGGEHRDVDSGDIASGHGAPGHSIHSSHGHSQVHSHSRPPLATRAASALQAVLGHPGWYSDAAVRELLRRPLLRLCQHYLLLHDRTGGAVCRVAAFHLSNGASMGRILWGADESPDGIARSAGLMVNYVYSRDGLDGLHATMTLGAPAYARSPGDVLAAQKPEIVDSQAADRAHGEA